MVLRRPSRVSNPRRLRKLAKLAVNLVRAARPQILNQPFPKRDARLRNHLTNRDVSRVWRILCRNQSRRIAGLRTKRFELSPEFGKKRNDAPVFPALRRLRRTNREALPFPIDVFPTRFERFRKAESADSIKREQGAKFRVVASRYNMSINVQRNEMLLRLVNKRAFRNLRKRILCNEFHRHAPRVNASHCLQDSRSSRRRNRLFQFRLQTRRVGDEQPIGENREVQTKRRLPEFEPLASKRRRFQRRRFRLQLKVDQLGQRQRFRDGD